jgi:hypothetical protein
MAHLTRHVAHIHVVFIIPCKDLVQTFPYALYLSRLVKRLYKETDTRVVVVVSSAFPVIFRIEIGPRERPAYRL